MTTGNEHFLATILARLSEMAVFDGCHLVALESHTDDGDTPLHMIAYFGDVDVLNGAASFIKDINVHGDIGNTPLHTAVIHKRVDMTARLIELGADASARNDYGDTPFDLLSGAPEFKGLYDRLAQSLSSELQDRGKQSEQVQCAKAFPTPWKTGAESSLE